MVYGMYLSAGGLQTSQYRQGVLTNNLANIDTVGFKEDLTIVRERSVESREDPTDGRLSHRVLDGMTGGSLVAPTYTSFQQGQLEVTSNPLDVAIEGEGFFVVQDGNDERYSRDGRFVRNEAGGLVTAAGNHPVLDEAGVPIVVPDAADGDLVIGGDGTVRVGDTSYGKLQTVTFDDLDKLRKVGGNLFEAIDVTPTPTRAHLQTRSIERSTVDPVRTMVALMQVARLYEMNATLVGLADSTLGRAVNDIARIR